MSKGGLGFSRTIDSNFRKLCFRDFIPKLVQNNTVIDDEYEGIQQVMARANHVMLEMEKDGMDFVSIQTMVIPKGEKTRTSLHGKKVGQVALSGRYRYNTNSKHPVDCFQIVRIWYRQKQGVIGITARPKQRKSVTWDDKSEGKRGSTSASVIGITDTTATASTATPTAITSSMDNVEYSNQDVVALHNSLSNAQATIDNMSKRVEELETKMCLTTRNQQMPEASSPFRKLTAGLTSITGSFTTEDSEVSQPASSGIPAPALEEIRQRLTTLEKKSSRYA